MSSARGRTAVITGGKGTLARATAAELRNAGYLVYAPGRDELDVTDAVGVESYFQTIEHLDLLINNAGTSSDALSVKMPPAQFQRVIDVNLSGAMRCARAALSRMTSGGHLIQIGSRSAWDGKIGQSNYAAAKAGLIGFTHGLAREVGALGIRVNCIAPGFLESPMTGQLSQAARSEIMERHCLANRNSPEDVARFILCLDHLAGVSGQVFQLDSRILAW